MLKSGATIAEDARTSDFLEFQPPQLTRDTRSVTMPIKAAVRAFLDEISPESQITNAVNTVVKVQTPTGVKLVGQNTDSETQPLYYSSERFELIYIVLQSSASGTLCFAPSDSSSQMPIYPLKAHTQRP